MCWHIYTRPPIGVTPSEYFISYDMCSDKISLKLGMGWGQVSCKVGFMFDSNWQVETIQVSIVWSFEGSSS